MSIATGRRLKLKDMKFFKQRFSAAPEGTAVLFFIQIFATLGFAVLYSTLVRFSPKPNRRLTLPLVHLFCSLLLGLPQSGVISLGRFARTHGLPP